MLSLFDQSLSFFHSDAADLGLWLGGQSPTYFWLFLTQLARPPGRSWCDSMIATVQVVAHIVGMIL